MDEQLRGCAIKRKRSDEQGMKVLALREELRVQTASLTKKHEKLEERKQALVKRNGGENVKDKIKLNVGGENMTVRRSTMTHFAGTRLAALFSGRWEKMLLRDKKKRIFLDVDPVCFKKLLDYHCLLKIAPPDQPPALELPEELQDSFERLLDFFGFDPPVLPLTIDSEIMTDAEQQSQVLSWVSEAMLGAGQGNPNSAIGATLLYRASRDGWTPSHFHSKCDNQGATVTVVKSTGGHVFGGYADVPWGKSRGSVYGVTSNSAFLFSLINASGTDPVKLPLTGADNGTALYHDSSYGPAFGIGHDLALGLGGKAFNHPDACYTRLGNSYQLPAGHSSTTFFTGAKCFQAAEVEVFSLHAVETNIRIRASASKQSKQSANSAGAGASAGSGAGAGAGAGDGDSADADGTAWQTADFDAICGGMAEALEYERQAVRVAEEQLQELEQQLDGEQAFIESFASGETKDIVELDVSGKRVAVRRSTLMLCAESMLARKFDDTVWLQEGRGTENDGMAGSSGSDSEDDVCFIEQPTYCFCKLVNQLRLKAISQPDEPPPKLSIVAHEKSNFEAVVKYFFPGVEGFILGDCNNNKLESRRS